MIKHITTVHGRSVFLCFLFAALLTSRDRGLAVNLGVIATNGVLHDRVADAVGETLFPTSRYQVVVRGKEAPSLDDVERTLRAQFGEQCDSLAVSKL